MLLFLFLCLNLAAAILIPLAVKLFQPPGNQFSAKR